MTNPTMTAMLAEARMQDLAREAAPTRRNAGRRHLRLGRTGHRRGQGAGEARH